MSFSRKFLFLFFIVAVTAQGQSFLKYNYQNYDSIKNNYIQLNGPLFRDVQLGGVFEDSKTFVDAVPRNDPQEILKLYKDKKNTPGFNLQEFVSYNFLVPGDKQESYKFVNPTLMDVHIRQLWDTLLRKPSVSEKNSTLIPLKFPYIVPGGRFREIYYWDSFFSILGLLADGKLNVAEDMVNNFAHLIDTYGMIPNGSRVYYLTRSQPPFFALMVDIICRYKKDYTWGVQYLDELETEYAFWMYGLDKLIPDEDNINTLNRLVSLHDEGILNRYYDFDTIPREESFKEDYMLARELPDSLRPLFFRNMRAAAESGWDFSSRWNPLSSPGSTGKGDSAGLSAIAATSILPVDLNCLIWFLEDRISFFAKVDGQYRKAMLFQNRADARKALINKIFWDEDKEFYFDFNLEKEEHTKVYSLAGFYPFYFGIAKTEYAEPAAEKILNTFLKPGGLVTTNNHTGQQWDAPNGWAPLQWMTVKGLREYNMNQLADDIRSRWLKLNENVYKTSGKMLEKYNVEDVNAPGGGGEYPLQDGFGWTNGVDAAFLKSFDELYLFGPLIK